MGDSLKEFLAARSRPLDDIPSEKHPEGKSYTFTAPPWKTTLALKAMYVMGVQAGAGVEPDAGQLQNLVSQLIEEQDEEARAGGVPNEEVLYRKVMGATFDELKEDGVNGDTMDAVFGLLFRKYGAGQDIAVQLAQARPAEEQPPGEAEAQPNRPTRRAAGRQAGSKSSPASGATPARTRSRVSTPASKTPAKPRAARKTA